MVLSVFPRVVSVGCPVKTVPFILNRAYSLNFFDIFWSFCLISMSYGSKPGVGTRISNSYFVKA